MTSYFSCGNVHIEGLMTLFANSLSVASGNLLVLPDANTELVATDVSQILCNKTINAAENTIMNLTNDNISLGAAISASKIGSGVVDDTAFNNVAGLSTPLQSKLDALEMRPLTRVRANSCVIATTTQSNFVQIPDMEITPMSGDWFVSFNAGCKVEFSTDVYEIAVFAGETMIEDSLRKINWDGRQIMELQLPISTTTEVELDGSTPLSVRWHTGGSGMITVMERKLFALRIV